MRRILFLAFAVMLSHGALAAFVQLDKDGKVVAVYANPQPSMKGIKELPDKDPKIAAFNERLGAAMDPKPQQVGPVTP